MTFPTRSQFNATVLKQFFVFPDSIIYYISKNPISPKCYQKMIQTCKYFFVENPILVLKLYHCDTEGLKIFDDEKSKCFHVKYTFTNKFWITDKFISWSNKDLYLLLTKVYRFDVKELELWNQIIYYDELLIMSLNVEKLRFYDVTVKHKNGSIVPFEEIVEAFPKIKSIENDYSNSSPSSISFPTFKELLKIPQFLTLDDCKLWEIPDDFDIESFYTYMKKNKHTIFRFCFSEFISNDFVNRLEEIVDEIIEDENRNYKPPVIKFHGLSRKKEEKLEEIFYR